MKKQKITKSKITKNMNFIEVLQKNPDSFEILMKNGMHCIGCGLAANETLEQGALMHGINPDKLIKELNQGLEKEKRKPKNKLIKSKTKIKKNKKSKSKR